MSIVARSKKNVGLLTEKEVAEMLNIHVQTLRNWRFHQKGLPYLKMSASVRYEPEEVEKFKNDCRIKHY